MADFNEQLPDWLEAGIEPPTSKKNEGWQVDDKPPAAWWNWLLNRTYKVLLEIRSVFSAHKADTTAHITAAERTAWNAKETPAGAQTKANAVQTNLTAHIGSGGAAHADVTTTTDGFMTAADKVKLDGVAAGANNYTHPATHPPSIIAQDASNRFVTDAEKTAWNAKASTAVATPTAAGLESAADKAKLDGIAANANAYVHPNHTGDVTSTGDGVTAIAPGVIVDADVNSAAAIAWSKISKTGASLADLPTRSAADLSSGTLPAARLPAISGDITMAAGAGTATITAGAIVNADINAAAAIDASKIGTGVVSNAEFGYLDGVTSGIQGQLNSKAPLATTPQQTTADITYYVRTDGNDSNTGLANTAAGAFKTIGKAVSMIPQVVNHTVAVNVAAGTYSEDVLIQGTNGSGYVAFNGTSATIRSINVTRCNRVVVTGFTANTTSSVGFTATDSGKVDFISCTITAAASIEGFIIQGGTVATIASCTISNRSAAIVSNDAAVSSGNNTGTGNTIGLYTNLGSIYTVGTQPAGAVGTNGGVISSGVVNPWGDNTSGNRSYVSAGHAVAQSIASTTITKILFSEEVDVLGEYDPALSRFTAKEAGIYHVQSAMLMLNTTQEFEMRYYLYKNGANTRYLDFNPLGSGASYAHVSGSLDIRLAKGDYLEVYLEQKSGATKNTVNDTAICYLTIERTA